MTLLQTFLLTIAAQFFVNCGSSHLAGGGGRQGSQEIESAETADRPLAASRDKIDLGEKPKTKRKSEARRDAQDGSNLIIPPEMIAGAYLVCAPRQSASKQVQCALVDGSGQIQDLTAKDLHWKVVDKKGNPLEHSVELASDSQSGYHVVIKVDEDNVLVSLTFTQNSEIYTFAAIFLKADESAPIPSLFPTAESDKGKSEKSEQQAQQTETYGDS
jgi:hypothetical protein